MVFKTLKKWGKGVRKAVKKTTGIDTRINKQGRKNLATAAKVGIGLSPIGGVAGVLAHSWKKRRKKK